MLYKREDNNIIKMYYVNKRTNKNYYVIYRRGQNLNYYIRERT